MDNTKMNSAPLPCAICEHILPIPIIAILKFEERYGVLQEALCPKCASQIRRIESNQVHGWMSSKKPVKRIRFKDEGNRRKEY